MKTSQVSLFVLSAVTASSVFAGTTTFDARQDAMGGAGVSSAHYLSAPFYNPALLARHDGSDDVGISLPAIGVEVNDKHDLLNTADDFTGNYDNFTSAYNNFLSNPSTENGNILAAANQKATSDLKALDGKSGSLNFGAGAAIAIPTDNISIALMANTYLDAHVFADVDNSDFTDATVNGITITLPTDENNIQSTATVIGAQVSDLGVTLASQVDGALGKTFIGVTPKMQQVTVMNYTANAANYDFDDLDTYETKKTSFNIDAGYAVEMDSNLTLGVAAKNIFTQKVSAPIVDGVQTTYKVSPLVTASLAWQPSSSFTLTGDLDLNVQERFSSVTNTGYQSSSDNVQMASVGAEWNAFDLFQTRVGYKYDLKGNASNMVTFGMGVSPFNVFHIDLAGMYGGQQELGVALQTSLTL